MVTLFCSLESPCILCIRCQRFHFLLCQTMTALDRLMDAKPKRSKGRGSKNGAVKVQRTSVRLNIPGPQLPADVDTSVRVDGDGRDGGVDGLDDADGASHAQTWIMSTPEGNPIAAEFLFLLHGAERADMTSFERVFNLFDGRSDAQVTQARAQWQEWRKKDELEMRYFAQDGEGKWEKRG